MKKEKFYTHEYENIYGDVYQCEVIDGEIKRFELVSGRGIAPPQNEKFLVRIDPVSDGSDKLSLKSVFGIK